MSAWRAAASLGVIASVLAGCGPHGRGPRCPAIRSGHPGFPLAVGMQWTYSVTIDYVDDARELRHWSGNVTRRVVAFEQRGEAQVFTMKTDVFPGQNEHRVTLRYVLLNGRLYEMALYHDLDKLLRSGGVDFEDDLELPASMDEEEAWGLPAHAIEDRGPVMTAAGHFKNCVWVVARSLPDDMNAWYCPGVGPVRSEYHHHGTRHDEAWELREHRQPGCQ